MNIKTFTHKGGYSPRSIYPRNLFVTSKKRNQEFTNSRITNAVNVVQSFQNEKARLKMFFKVMNKKYYTIKKGF